MQVLDDHLLHLGLLLELGHLVLHHGRGCLGALDDSSLNSLEVGDDGLPDYGVESLGVLLDLPHSFDDLFLEDVHSLVDLGVDNLVPPQLVLSLQQYFVILVEVEVLGGGWNRRDHVLPLGLLLSFLLVNQLVTVAVLRQLVLKVLALGPVLRLGGTTTGLVTCDLAHRVLLARDILTLLHLKVVLLAEDLSLLGLWWPAICALPQR